MSRRVKLPTQEKGILEVEIVWGDGDHWESEWEPLRQTHWAGLMSVVPAEVMEHALRGWSKPLVSVLGLPPEGALRKIPPENRDCQMQGSCAIHDKSRCFPIAKELPWCFEPRMAESEAVRAAASRLVRLWHEGVYVVVTHGR